MVESVEEMESEEVETEEEVNDEEQRAAEKRTKKKKRGIIYLSKIPKFMNIAKIREIFSAYGEVGRIYLQVADNEATNKKKKRKKKVMVMNFAEGWVEFESKKVAKYVTATLNNTQISTRKRSKFFDVIWNIKYLPRFKWIHLSERLAYERAVHKQRLRTEIAQAKREASFFSFNVDRSQKLKRKEGKGEKTELQLPVARQRETDAEIRSKKATTNQEEDRTDFLKSLFG